MENVKLKVFGPSPNSKTSNNHKFVQATHSPTGLIVTKYGHTQVYARDMALLALDNLVSAWENESMDGEN